MKYIVFILALLITSCNLITKDVKDVPPSKPVQNQDDPNYTGVKKVYQNGILLKETTYKNGIKEGLNKNYYDDGRLKRTIWYENGLREDTAKYFRRNGRLYRATPYKNDKIHGVQTKYYESRRVWAQLPYKHGNRLPGLKEYYDNGLEVGNIPTISYNLSTKDYEAEGIVTILLNLSNKSLNVKYYKGGIVDGAFDETKAKDVTAATGMGYCELFKSETGGKGYVNIVAVYTTRFKNKEIIIKRIQLPYNDLK